MMKKRKLLSGILVMSLLAPNMAFAEEGEIIIPAETDDMAISETIDVSPDYSTEDEIIVADEAGAEDTPESFTIDIDNADQSSDLSAGGEDVIQIEADSLNSEEDSFILQEDSEEVFSLSESSWETEVCEEENISLDGISLPGDEELFAGYVDKTLGTELFEDPDAISMLSSTDYAGSNLNQNSRLFYNYMKTEINKIADGSITSTEFKIPVTVFFDKMTYTGEELGQNIYDPVTGNKIDSFNLKDAVDKVLDISWVNAIYSVIYDCSYELYWFDKSKGCSFTRPIVNTHCDSPEELSKGGVLDFTGSYIQIELYVSPYYAAQEGASNTLSTNPAKTSAAVNALENVNKIITDNAARSDYDKLVAYKEKICELVSYDSSVMAPTYNKGYGDPWQLIYVFDNDPNTNVVCEGYSKAFAYLCEKSTFNADIKTYNIGGILNINEGHSWNIVTMEDGQNYLVDVTNCDEDTIGYPDLLFLAGTSLGDELDGYIFQIGSTSIRYKYSGTMMNIYPSYSNLKLAKTNYKKSTTDITDKFTDPAFKAKVIEELGTATITREACQDISVLDVSSAGIESLKGIEYFTGLEELNCTDNKLTELDLSTCPNLKYLKCSKNSLSALDVTPCRNLTFLYCASNSLDALDVSGCTNLKYIDCRDNFLTNVDLSTCLNLKYLFCGKNFIGELDMSSCNNLEYMECADNALESLDLGNCSSLNTLECSSNFLKPDTLLLPSGLSFDKVAFARQCQIISLSASSYEKTMGDPSFSLGAAASTPISYTSDNTAVADVSSDGNVTIKGAGSAVISLNAEESDLYFSTDYTGGVKKVSITVSQGSQTISTPASSYTKTYGDAAFALNASAKTELSYVSGDTSVATVDADGTVTLKGAGTAVITVTAKETADYKGATKDINLTVKPQTISISKIGPSTSGISLSWTKAESADGYVISRSTDGTNFYVLATIPNRLTLSYIDTKATSNGQKYYYRVRTYKGSLGGTYSPVKYYWRLTTPIFSGVSNTYSGRITASYSRNTAATGYQIYKNTSTSLTGGSIATITGNTSLSYTSPQLTIGSTYYVRIRSFKKIGDNVYVSPWGVAKAVTISK